MWPDGSSSWMPNEEAAHQCASAPALRDALEAVDTWQSEPGDFETAAEAEAWFEENVMPKVRAALAASRGEGKP